MPSDGPATPPVASPSPSIPPDDDLGPMWPPSPKMQILLITIAFILLNILLIAGLVIVLWQRG